MPNPEQAPVECRGKDGEAIIFINGAQVDLGFYRKLEGFFSSNSKKPTMADYIGKFTLKPTGDK